MTFNQIEKKIGISIARFPLLKRIFKYCYQSLNYYVQNNKIETQILDAKWSLHTVLPQDYLERNQNTEDFFGYYDISPWSEDQRHILTHLKNSKLSASIAKIDTITKYVEIVADTQAFNLQQGARLHWVPNQKNTILFNSYNHGKDLVANLYQDQELLAEFLFPIQVLHPESKEYLSINYRRLFQFRPDYGYALPSRNFDNLALHNDGIWQVSLATGKAELIVSFLDLMVDEQTRKADKHKINHCLYLPGGNGFVFLHRFYIYGKKFSRLYLYKNQKLSVLLDQEMISHYCWISNTQLFAWARVDQSDAFYIIDSTTHRPTVASYKFINNFGDGHPSYCEKTNSIVYDSYPDRSRLQYLNILHRNEEKLGSVAKFFSPLIFNEENRCDLHPRWRKDGLAISIDSLHSGKRHQYILKHEAK